jgi:D-aminopeptidase
MTTTTGGSTRRINSAYRASLVHSHERPARLAPERLVRIRCTHPACAPRASRLPATPKGGVR